MFGDNFIQLRTAVDQNGGRYPAATDLAGKVVLYWPGDTLGGCHADHCVSREMVERSIAGNVGVEDASEQCGPEGCRVFRLDQYQADWTFDYGVPPNPIIVDGTVTPPSFVLDPQGDQWDCDNGDLSHGEVVAQQGTYRFPYKTVGRAIARAEGTTPNGVRDFRRAGWNWTVLIRPGNYAESIKIDFPLTLKRDPRFGGAVIITGQQARMIRSLWITFHTTNDNKDPDTGLEVRITSNDGRVLARFHQARDKEYKEGFTHTEQLQLSGPVFERDVSNATLEIDISPNGSDTWHFDWQLDGTWNDGVAFSDRSMAVRLNETQRHFEKVLAI